MLNKDLKLSESINISCTAEELWDVLTNPAKIAVYLYGTETLTDWKEGSEIIFQGEYEGHVYKDSGVILEFNPFTQLKYSYWSGFSGLECLAENHATITYTVEDLGGSCKFTWSQEGYAGEENLEYSKEGMPALLNRIKELAEE